jgi:hypothetical protein
MSRLSSSLAVLVAVVTAAWGPSPITTAAVTAHHVDE